MVRSVCNGLWLAAVLLSACSEPPPATDGQVEGALLGRSLTSHIAESRVLRAPFRCARFAQTQIGPVFDRVQWDGDTGSVVVQPKSGGGSIAVLSDFALHNVSPEAIERLRTTLNREGVDMVFSLGGLGTTQEEIAQILAPLTESADYLVMAGVGDRESVLAHREAVEQVAKLGRRVLDTSRFRLSALGTLRIATMPGIAKPAHLVAGDNGCLHTAEDVDELASKLGDEAPTLLLSYSPWRQEGGEATDMGIAGVHVGEKLLRPLASLESPMLLVHGMTAANPQTPEGRMRLASPPGSLSAVTQDATVLVLSVTGARLDWKRLSVQ